MSSLLSQSRRACRSDLPVLKRAHSADTQPAHDDIIYFQRDATFGRYYARQGEMYQPSAQHGILGSFGGALKSHCCMCLVSRRFDAAKLGVVTALQVEQMPAIVYYGDDDVPVVASSFILSCCRNALGVFQGEYGFAHHDYYLPDKAAMTCSQMLSTLPTPEILMYFGAFGSPDFAHAV